MLQGDTTTKWGRDRAVLGRRRVLSTAFYGTSVGPGWYQITAGVLPAGLGMETGLLSIATAYAAPAFDGSR